MITVGDDVKQKQEFACLGKIRSDLQRKHFYFYDNNVNPKKSGKTDTIREQLGVLTFPTTQSKLPSFSFDHLASNQNKQPQ